MLRNFLKDTKGTALLEFAFLLPVLAVLSTGAIQFGWGIYVNHALLEAVRSTARSVAVGEIEQDDATVTVLTETVSSRMSINVAGIAVTPTFTDDTVTISGSIPKANVAIIDILGLFNDGQLTSTSTMRLE